MKLLLRRTLVHLGSDGAFTEAEIEADEYYLSVWIALTTFENQWYFF